jgi:hypothetical protein
MLKERRRTFWLGYGRSVSEFEVREMEELWYEE